MKFTSNTLVVMTFIAAGVFLLINKQDEWGGCCLVAAYFIAD
jgi:hypothetical protein